MLVVPCRLLVKENFSTLQAMKWGEGAEFRVSDTPHVCSTDTHAHVHMKVILLKQFL